jgi:spore germination protein KA
MKNNTGKIKKILKLLIYKRSDKEKPFVLEEGMGGSQEKIQKAAKENSSSKITNSLDENLDTNFKRVEKEFNIPLNVDAIVRRFKIGAKVDAFILYIEGMADRNVTNDFILRQLMSTQPISGGMKKIDISYVSDNLMTSNNTSKVTLFSEVVKHVMMGDTVLFVEGSKVCLAMETKGFEKRSIESPKMEAVVAGSQEGFTENLKTNTTMIRKIVKNNKLVNRQLSIGADNNMMVSVMYIEGIANPAVVDEAIRRLSSIKTDFTLSGGMLEQFLEDQPLNICPQTLQTERPDRAALHLAEGRVAILGDNSPSALIVPVTFFSLLQSPEDQYLKWQFASGLRMIRIGALFSTLLLSAFYIAVINFHHQLIPSDIMTTLVKARENIPFPSLVELLLLEFSFELIREGGIRIPGAIGNTLGIIGALILGQAAVAANLVSPMTIIIVAIGGLGNFAIPNYHLAFSFRIMRFFFIFAAGSFGLLGIAIALTIYVSILCSMRSFGVEYLAPIAPQTRKGWDTVLKYPVWKQEERPDYINALKEEAQPHVSMGWRKNKIDKRGE